MTASSGQKLYSVQVLRFYAALMVLIGHVFLQAHKNGLISDDMHGLIERVPWGAGVDLFFIISGFIITFISTKMEPSVENTKNFLLRRIIRIVPIYWFYSLLMVLAIVLFSGLIDKSELSPAHVLTSFLFIPWPNENGILRPILAQGWTLNYEMFFYVIATGALLLANSSRKYYIAAVLIGLNVIGYFFEQNHFIFSFFANTVMLEFLYGMMLYAVYVRVRTIPLPVALALFATGVGLWILAGTYIDENDFRALARGFPALLISASLIMMKPLQSGHNKFNQFLVLLGDASYSLYLCHPFALVPFAYIWNKIGLESLSLFVITAITASIIASLFSYLLLERNMMRILHKATNSYKRQTANIYRDKHA